MHDHSRDFELIALIRDNQEEYVEELIQRYHKSIWAIIHKLVKPPAPSDIDTEDLYQEGCLGLMRGVENFDKERNILFVSFANKCIENEIRSYLRKHRTQNYRMLSTAISLDMPISDDDNLCLMDTVSSNQKEYDPAYLAHIAWAQDQVPVIRESLTDAHWKVYHKHHLGYSYREISLELGITEKDVDNIIQKIKKKVRVMFDTL